VENGSAVNSAVQPKVVLRERQAPEWEPRKNTGMISRTNIGML
jgi:hypothetical protein